MPHNTMSGFVGTFTDNIFVLRHFLMSHIKIPFSLKEIKGFAYSFQQKKR